MLLRGCPLRPAMTRFHRATTIALWNHLQVPQALVPGEARQGQGRGPGP